MNFKQPEAFLSEQFLSVLHVLSFLCLPNSEKISWDGLGSALKRSPTGRFCCKLFVGSSRRAEDRSYIRIIINHPTQWTCICPVRHKKARQFDALDKLYNIMSIYQCVFKDDASMRTKTPVTTLHPPNRPNPTCLVFDAEQPSL